MNFRLVLAAAAFCAALPATLANAAPQLLGLLADNAIPVHCVDDVCTVEVSAICLQEERAMPAWGTTYRPIQSKRITLVGTRADGTAISRPIDDIARFEADRGHWAVKITIPRHHVESFGVERSALSIDGRVALAPMPTPGDPTPQTDADIEAAVTAFAKSPDSVIGAGADNMAAAHILNEMINALPHVALDKGKPAGDLWRKTFGSEALDRPGMKKAAAYYRQCGHELLQVDRKTVRRCLELGHDNFATTVNRRYWDANKPGV